MGETDRAIEFYQQALTIAQGTGDRRGESTWAWNLGRLYEDLGQPEQALPLLQLRVDYERAIGLSTAEDRALYVAEVSRKVINEFAANFGSVI